jgi:protocatechuate 3,4-dioxygenase beta subunit
LFYTYPHGFGLGGALVKTFIPALLMFSLATPMPAQTPKNGPTEKKDETIVSGMVVKLADSEPLRKARVNLRSADDNTHSISVVTDSAGQFRLKASDAGRYHLTVSRVGFVSQEYGQKKPDDPGALLTLRPGQEVKDLLFRLIPSAVIAGKILDEDGEPLPEIQVSALRQVYLEGKRSLATETMAQTNDLGEYRLFGLRPGRYFVSAVFPPWGRFSGDDDSEEAQSNHQGYAKMFYPGTPEAAKAIPVSVKSGEEIPSVQIFMHQLPVYRIRGHVYNQITHKTGRQTNVFLTPKTKSREWGDERQNFVQKPDGSFEISDVLPGSYVLIAMWYDEGSSHSARIPVEVSSADVEGIAITITPGTDIAGRIIWEGTPSLEQDELFVMLESPETSVSFGGRSRVTPGNTFLLKSVGDGAYMPRIWGEGKDCYTKDVQYAGASALEDGFTLSRAAPGTLEITISARGARVRGSVADSDGLPVAGVHVVLVPERSRRTRYRLYNTQTTDQYGHFELRGIAPGDYKLFSWEEVESGAWEDPEFLKDFEDKGEKISLQEAEQKSVNLTAIRTKATESAKP